jgi:hypothetical protein
MIHQKYVIYNKHMSAKFHASATLKHPIDQLKRFKHVLLPVFTVVMSKCLLCVVNERRNNYMFTHRYISIVYLSFTSGIPSEAERLFNLPAQWPAYCGNANTDKL